MRNLLSNLSPENQVAIQDFFLAERETEKLLLRRRKPTTKPSLTEKVALDILVSEVKKVVEVIREDESVAYYH